MSVILGINARHAGASAAIVVDGKPKLAIAEERLNRIKNYADFPAMAIQRCLDDTGISWHDVDAVAIGRDPSANRLEKIKFALNNPLNLTNFIKMRSARSSYNNLKELISNNCHVDPDKLKFCQYNIEHHISHTASSYFTSDQDKAAGLTVDGSGDFVSTMMTECLGDKIIPISKTYVPNSLGSFYTMICSFIGYDSYGDEGKVMGLAPLGEDNYHDLVKDMVHITKEGFKLNSDWFAPFGSNQGISIGKDGKMQIEKHYSEKMIATFGEPRVRNSNITKRDMDLAYSLQHRFEVVYLELLNLLYKKVPINHLALSGGCALNSVANGMIYEKTPFESMTIQPAAGDDGHALGSALYVARSILSDGDRWVMDNAYLGTEYS